MADEKFDYGRRFATAKAVIFFEIIIFRTISLYGIVCGL